MRRILTSIAATAMVLSLFLAYAGVASANHYYATGQTDRRIILLGNCGGSIPYDAEEGFYVAHGFRWPSWSDTTPEEKRNFMHPATYFELSIDGVLQKSSMRAWYNSDTDTKLKLFVTEDHNGLLAGQYTFEGIWWESDGTYGGDFRDSVFYSSCTVTVNVNA